MEGQAFIVKWILSIMAMFTPTKTGLIPLKNQL